MKRLILSAAALSLYAAAPAFAVDQYNAVPAGDAQYASCKKYSLNKWNGGEEASPIPGQNKAEAFCSCLWNETPDDFKGGLAKFSESPKGAEINAICEKYSNWGG
jgi:hypothetical protein